MACNGYKSAKIVSAPRKFLIIKGGHESRTAKNVNLFRDENI